MIHKKILIGAAMVSLISGTSFAQDQLSTDPGTVELRLRAVVVDPEDSSSSISGIGGVLSTSVTAGPELDFTYFFTKDLAIEASASASDHTVSAHSTSINNPTVGDVWLLPPTVTLQYHFGNGATIDPYVGIGANYAIFLDASHQGPFSSVSYDNTLGAAFQAGADFSLGGGWVANFDMKQLLVSTTAHTTIGDTVVNAKDDINPLLIGIGIGYRWGATVVPAAYVPPPAPPVTPPPPPPVVRPEAARSFQVFFDFNKSDITAAAAKVIQAAADTVNSGGFAHIDVTGHTDTVGSAAYNQGLSERRAAAVKAQLVADGVATTEISTRGVGKTGLLVPTADGVREAQNRRAEIELK